MPRGSRARFDGAHDLHGIGSDLLLQERLARCTDAVLAGHGPAQRDRGAIELLAGGVRALLGGVRRRGPRRRSGGGCRHRRGRTCRSARRGRRRCARSRDSSSGIRERGTPTSSMRATPRRSMARNARRRTWRSQSASIGSVARTTERRAGGVGAAGSARASSSSAAVPGAVGLDEQQRRSGAVQSEGVPVVDSRDGDAVHELQRAGLDARRRSWRPPPRRRRRRSGRRRAASASAVEPAVGEGPPRSRSRACPASRRTGGSASSRRRPSRCGRRCG